MAHTTDKSSHAKWEFNCKQFLWIMGPSVPPYAKGEKKKKIPVKKKKCFSLSHPPNRLPKKQSLAFFWLQAGIELGPTVGGFLHCGPGKVRGWGRAGVS